MFYMIDTDGSIVTLLDKVVQLNSIAFDSKNEAMYVVDTWNKTLLRWDYSLAHGPTGAPEVVIRFDDMPDGAVVDADDNLYVGHWSDKRIVSIWSLKDYAHVKTLDMPVKHNCCPGFGGDDLCDLYVATSKFWLPDGDPDFETGAGGIFVGRNEVPGLPERIYPDQSLHQL